ncbi:MAG: hypothetical protein ACP5XB_22005 [Isosphaeraceae bacterium]
MAIDRKGVMGIRTMAALVDQRRTRTAAGALLELSALANEKLLLEREVARASRRGAEIRRRLKEIAAKEDRLMKIVQGAPPAQAASVQAVPPQTPPSPAPEPVAVADPVLTGRFKISEFSY